MNKLSRQLIKVAKEIDLIDQILKLNSQLKILQITKDLNIKLRDQFLFGKIEFQSNAKTDWAFKLKIFNDKLLQEGKKLYELINKLKQSSKNDEGDLYDEQTGEFIGVQLNSKNIKKFDFYLKEIKNSELKKYMPEFIESLEQFKQNCQEFTNKYGEGKHGKKIKDQFNKLTEQFTSKFNYLSNKYQKQYGKNLQKLPKEEVEQLNQIIELFDF